MVMPMVLFTLRGGFPASKNPGTRARSFYRGIFDEIAFHVWLMA
jgi:hypothetical protein